MADTEGSLPAWAATMRGARELEQEAERWRRHALDLQCDVEESGGARCTADREPEHAHRYRQEDLP